MVEVSKRSHKRRVDSINASRHLSAEDLRAAKCSTCKSRNRDRQTVRREAADARDSKRLDLSPAEQIKALDARLGKDVGAKKERERLRFFL